MCFSSKWLHLFATSTRNARLHCRKWWFIARFRIYWCNNLSPVLVVGILWRTQTLLQFGTSRQRQLCLFYLSNRLQSWIRHDRWWEVQRTAKLCWNYRKASSQFLKCSVHFYCCEDLLQQTPQWCTMNLQSSCGYRLDKTRLVISEWSKNHPPVTLLSKQSGDDWCHFQHYLYFKVCVVTTFLLHLTFHPSWQTPGVVAWLSFKPNRCCWKCWRMWEQTDSCAPLASLCVTARGRI